MKKGEQQCLLYSLAMASDIPIGIVKNHFPQHDTKRNDGTMRGVHFQEVLDWLLKFNRSCTLIEDKAFFEDATEVEFTRFRFHNHIASSKGVLIGFNSRGKCHAVANDHGIQCDPAIRKRNLEAFQYWRIDKIT